MSPSRYGTSTPYTQVWERFRLLPPGRFGDHSAICSSYRIGELARAEIPNHLIIDDSATLQSALLVAAEKFEENARALRAYQPSDSPNAIMQLDVITASTARDTFKPKSSWVRTDTLAARAVWSFCSSSRLPELLVNRPHPIQFSELLPFNDM